jgi:hypothetical protein
MWKIEAKRRERTDWGRIETRIGVKEVGGRKGFAQVYLVFILDILLIKRQSHVANRGLYRHFLLGPFFHFRDLLSERISL